MGPTSTVDRGAPRWTTDPNHSSPRSSRVRSTPDRSAGWPWSSDTRAGSIRSILLISVDPVPEHDPTPSRDGPLSETEVAHLVAALDDEYQARATYAQVIEDFGSVRPFANIIEAENRHAQALVRIFERYGIPVPLDTWPGRVPRYGSLREACEAGVAAEIANAALYDELIAGTDRADIVEVYRNLQEASQQRHLPAFRRCTEHGGSDQAAPASTEREAQHRRRRRHRGGR